MSRFWLLVAVVGSLSQGVFLGAAQAAGDAVSERVLEQALHDRRDRVPEFRFIQAKAKELGVRVYLFGGTASGFAHYVRWDLLREAGDTRYQPDRFDYDFTNIYRANQDLDIVVDGPKSAIETLRGALKSEFPHLQGQKDAWEVRSLREDMGGTKIALLNNPDFLNQNSDSNSTGLIELSDSNEPITRDLFDWNANPSAFLDDLAHGSIRYYRNPNHDQTARAKAGQNPEIVSAVRYLIKVVQFELEMRPEDERVIRSIIADFRPRDAKNDYVARKLEEIGKKLIQNAVNIEFAGDLITRIGLKEKLLSISNPGQQDSMGWWINKEPLRTKPVGEGRGKTASQLGLTMVAHETMSFQAYESMTRAHTGEPNVLISRGGVVGEAAAHGDGFYTQIGSTGARGTGITIRFLVEPTAREKTDFSVHGNYVVFHNKAALRVIPSTLNFTTLQYFRFLVSGEFDRNDRGGYERLMRRMKQRNGSDLDPHDLPEVKKYATAALDNFEKEERAYESQQRRWDEPRRTSAFPEVVSAWTRLHQAADDLELLIRIIRIAPDEALPGIAEGTLFRDDMPNGDQLLEEFAKRRAGRGRTDTMMRALAMPRFKSQRQRIFDVIATNYFYPESIAKILRTGEWSGDETSITRFTNAWITWRREIKDHSIYFNSAILEQILTLKPGPKRSELLESLFRNSTSVDLIYFLKSMAATRLWEKEPSALTKMLRIYFESPPTSSVWSGYGKISGVRSDWVKLFSQWIIAPHDWSAPEMAPFVPELRKWVSYLGSQSQEIDSEERTAFYTQVAQLPIWESDPKEIADLILSRQDRELAYRVLSRPEWRKHPDVMKRYIEVDAYGAVPILASPTWRQDLPILRHFLEVEKSDEHGISVEKFVKEVLNSPREVGYDSLVETILNSKIRKVDAAVASLFTNPEWSNRPDLFVRTFGTVPMEAVKSLRAPHWAQHPEVLEAFLNNVNGQFPDEQVTDFLKRDPWRSNGRIDDAFRYLRMHSPAARRLLPVFRTAQNLRAAFALGFTFTEVRPEKPGRRKYFVIGPRGAGVCEALFAR